METTKPTRSRILQLSDLHLTAAGGRRAWGTDVWKNFERALEIARSLEPFDALVLTGDLANMGQRRAYEMLRQSLGDDLRRCFVLPGNHDNRRRLRTVFADRCTMDSKTVNFVIDVGQHRLIGLDSLRRFRVHGLLGKPQIDWLSQQLAATSRPVLLFLHHPPTKVGTWWLDRDALRDADELASCIDGTSVRGLFFGHVHQGWSGMFAGVETHSAPSAAYQFRPASLRPGAVARREPALRVIDLIGDKVATHVVTADD